MRVGLLIAVAAMLALVFSAMPAQANQIAGLAPDRRPDGAPVVTEYPKGADWYAGALIGVVEPYPASLRFLEDQGAWFTPFIRPGMSGPYDLRGLHRPVAYQQQ